MSSESDYRQQWAELFDISEELLNPDTALIISSDRTKKILLGNEDTDPEDNWPKSLYSPIDYEDLASLYQLGMQRKADLFLQYVLRKDGFLLLEDVGILDGLNLTKYPSRKFEDWTVPPSFLSLDSKSFDPRVHSVQRWRRRVYVLGSDRFMELIWHPYVNGWERVDRYRLSTYNWSGVTSPDELLNSKALIESLLASTEIHCSSTLVETMHFQCKTFSCYTPLPRGRSRARCEMTGTAGTQSLAFRHTSCGLRSTVTPCL